MGADSKKGLNNDPVGNLNEIISGRHNLDEWDAASNPNPNATDDMKTRTGGNNGKNDQPSYDPPKQVGGV